MTRSTYTFVVTVALAAMAPAARADTVEDFGAKGQFIISADRLSPLLSYSRIEVDQDNGNSTTTSTTSMAFLWASGAQDFYDVPRLGFDYVIAPSITLGGALFATLPLSASQSTKQGGTTTTQDTNSSSAFGIAGRGGYIAQLTPHVAFWGRGALSYTYVSTKTPDGPGKSSASSSTSQLALDLEPLFVLSPVRHVGITLGPVLDVPLTGNRHDEGTIGGITTSTDHDTSQLHFGISAGLLGWF